MEVSEVDVEVAIEAEVHEDHQQEGHSLEYWSQVSTNKKKEEITGICAGLPPSGSWQDLKDHMREAGDVCFADAFKDGSGVVEFLRYEDMKYAIKKLDDSRFRSHEVSRVFVEYFW